MINVFFFLKFKTQLRRTKPDIVSQIDDTLIRAITDAGGRISGERSLISAVFNEDSTGFWLDMYIMIENMRKLMEASVDLFGYALVIGNKGIAFPEQLCRFLSGKGGVFLDSKATKKFIPYAEFEKPSEWLNDRKVSKYGSNGFFRIKELTVFKTAAKSELDLHRDVFKILEREQKRNILILGPEFSHLRGGLYKYLKKINNEFPAVTICFGGTGLSALIDAWSGSIRSLSNASTEEIDNLWELLFRDRIRDEVSDFIIRSVKRYLFLLFEYYFSSAQKKKRVPVLVLENIHLATDTAMNLLLDFLSAMDIENKKNLYIIGTGQSDIQPEKMRKWSDIFKNTRTIDKEEKTFVLPRLPMELWEIVCAVSIFSRYFSPELYQRLFEEDEKNPAMIARAFSILHTLGVIDNPREPRLMNRHFEEKSMLIPEDKSDRVKTLVRRRLLNWAAKRNINPCFRLLTIIASLDGVNQIDDLLLLKSISGDIINNTTSDIEAALGNGQFDELFNTKAAAIKYIYRTSHALHAGNEADIENAFKELPAECESFSILKSQIIVNFCAYYLGCRDIAAASAKAKEAILLGQNSNSFCLPQAYRLFSLVCLSRQQAAETIEYLNFALSNAEKAGNYYEMGISAYYAAASQFLYGDIFNAKRLARKSIEQSLAVGRPEWADLSRFLEGRLYFELGDYREALDIFQGLHREPFGAKTEEKDHLFDAWIYRSKIYSQNPRISRPENANHDALLFEIEAAYLAEDYERAVELSGAFKNPFSQENFLYTEQPDWRSGYMQCEYLFFSHGEIQDRFTCLFNSLALSRLSSLETAKPGSYNGDEAMQNMQRILRDERLCEMDPWDAFYFYAMYRVLENTGANIVDMSTAVSMAFKRLQRRASRIEDVETRRQYLNGTRWNRELCLAAREFKLI
jgi:tetratricopeptide (TPR) repeat protein